MNKKRTARRLLSLFLTVWMLVGMVPTGVFAAETPDASGTVTASLKALGNPTLAADPVGDVPDETSYYDKHDVVRVSVVLDEPAAIEAGFSTKDIAQNADAAIYREALLEKQDELAEVISDTVLGGEELDVVWNLTLAANLISANVEYGKIDAIRALPGVESVILETSYEPLDVSASAEPNM